MYIILHVNDVLPVQDMSTDTSCMYEVTCMDRLSMGCPFSCSVEHVCVPDETLELECDCLLDEQDARFDGHVESPLRYLDQ